VDSPLFSLWTDIKKGISNAYSGGSVVKKVVGNLEYQQEESPELVMKTLFIVMKDRASFNKTEIIFVKKILK
jgi:hypothetical protein